MAIFPCDLCRKRYAGKSNAVYIGWMAGGYSDRQKFNLCPNDAEGMMQKIRGHFTLIERGGVMQTDDAEISGQCETCGLEPTTNTWFANTYIRTEEPEVWARGVCAKDSATIAQAFNIAP